MKKYFCKATRGALALSSVGLIASAVTLHAGDNISGFYVGADAGINFESDLTYTGSGIPYQLSVQTGVRADATVGYAIKLTDHLTIGPEVEGGVIYNTINQLSSGIGNFSGTGSITQIPVMGNAVLKWHFCRHWIAYGGAGAGYDYNTLEFNSAPYFNEKNNESDFAWQVMGGVKYKLGRNELGVGYTYFAYTPSGFKSVGNNTIFVSYTFDF